MLQQTLGQNQKVSPCITSSLTQLLAFLVLLPDSLRSVGIKNPVIVMESAAVGSAAVLGFLMARKSRCPGTQFAV